MHPGDVYAINDPYAGGTHFTDVRLIRPIFADDEVIGFASRTAIGRTSAAACRAPSTSPPREMFREGLRITPVRLFDKGRFCRDVAHLIASQHPRSGLDHRRHAVPGSGHPGLRARDPAAGQQIRPATRS